MEATEIRRELARGAEPGKLHIQPGGQVFAAPLPRCPTHGQMSRGEGHWVCHGFDGEGCDYEVTDEDADWQYIGTVDSITLSPIPGFGLPGL